MDPQRRLGPCQAGEPLGALHVRWGTSPGSPATAAWSPHWSFCGPQNPSRLPHPAGMPCRTAQGSWCPPLGHSPAAVQLPRSFPTIVTPQFLDPSCPGHRPLAACSFYRVTDGRSGTSAEGVSVCQRAAVVVRAAGVSCLERPAVSSLSPGCSGPWFEAADGSQAFPS